MGAAVAVTCVCLGLLLLLPPFHVHCVYKCASAFVCLRVKGPGLTVDPKI